MSVNGISYLNGYKPMYGRKSQENNQTPVSFGYGNDDYQSSVANSYIQKQQAQKQQIELEKQKKDKWKQFGLDVLKGVTIGAALIGGTALVASCTKAGREMAQSLTNSIGSTSTATANDLNDDFLKQNPHVKKEDILRKIKEMPLSGAAKEKSTLALISANADAVNSIESFKKTTSTGLLLYGLPGVGKSYSAKQFAESFGAKYVKLDVNSFKNSYVGESTKNIDRQIMPIINEAKEHPDTPYFIIMEEADSLLSDTNDSSGVNNEMRSIFLQRMDADNVPCNVKYILTTNFPERITSAAIRTGRLQATKINNPTYDKLKKIYKNELGKTFGKYLENEEDLNEVINEIPIRYPVLGPAHIKAVTEKLNLTLLTGSEKLRIEDIRKAFVSAHQKACAEYFQRCDAIIPSKTTSYDVDEDNLEYAKNLARVCLLLTKDREKINDDNIDLLANNIPIELMPKAIGFISQLTQSKKFDTESIKQTIQYLNSQGFKIGLQMNDLQDCIDEDARRKEESLRTTQMS